MRIPQAILNSPTLRFFAAALGGVAGTFALAILLIYGLGARPAFLDLLAVLGSMLPITSLLALLGAGAFTLISKESKLGAWLLGLFIPTALSFEACSLLYLLNSGNAAGHDRYSGLFVLVNVILALIVSLITCASAHKLKHMAEKEKSSAADSSRPPR